MFDSLNKIFYSNQENHLDIYKKRFQAPFSVHFDIDIKQFNHEKSYPAFFYYNQDLALLSENIYSSFQKLILLMPSMPQIVLHQFELSCLVDEVHSTSSIEGIHSTHRELKDIIDGNSRSKHFSSIIRKYELLLSNQILHFHSCEDVRNFYDEFAHDDIIAENPNHKLDGKIFRKDTVDVQSATGKIIHRGLYPEEKVIDTMNKALYILNDENIPALVRIAIFHYLFVYIHPFYDGNGRTDRFISSCYIAEHLHYLIALRLSVTIKRQRKKYYDLINDTDNEFNCGDLTPFIYGFMSFILETTQEITKKLSRKIKQLETFKKRLFTLIPDDNFLKEIGELLLQTSTFYGRGLSMDEIIKFTGKSRNTIKKKLKSLPSRVISITGSRKKFYKINLMRVR